MRETVSNRRHSERRACLSRRRRQPRRRSCRCGVSPGVSRGAATLSRTSRRSRAPGLWLGERPSARFVSASHSSSAASGCERSVVLSLAKGAVLALSGRVTSQSKSAFEPHAAARVLDAGSVKVTSSVCSALRLRLRFAEGLGRRLLRASILCTANRQGKTDAPAKRSAEGVGGKEGRVTLRAAAPELRCAEFSAAVGLFTTAPETKADSRRCSERVEHKEHEIHPRLAYGERSSLPGRDLIVGEESRKPSSGFPLSIIPTLFLKTTLSIFECKRGRHSVDLKVAPVNALARTRRYHRRLLRQRYLGSHIHKRRFI